ncbi:hypothetical protein HRbin15_01190 [bacterium HR15]|nr:hypothetical protein HRbin15_01190 [bacterium HR15]
MTRSARFAWWLMILLFSLLIFFNNLVFLSLFFYKRGSSLTQADLRYELDFQMRYVLSFAGSSMLRQGLKPAAKGVVDALRKELYGTEGEWEARLYVALMEQLTGVGDPEKTLKGLANASSVELEPHERRWYAPLWHIALQGQLSREQVPRLRDALSLSAPPLALQIAESVMWQRAGDAQRARQLLHKLERESQLRLSLLVAVGCCGLFWGIVGVGLLLWYLVQPFPLAQRPLPNASPFVLDRMLWAPALFLLLLLYSQVLLVSWQGRDVAPTDPLFGIAYAIAAFVPLLFLWSWSREPGNPSGILRFQGSVWRQIGSALMGFGIYLPIMLLSLLLTIWLAPALPSEQTSPIAETPLSEMEAWMRFWTILQVVVLAPMVEEVLFRGVLFQVLWQRTGRVWLSAFASGFLFGVIHPQFLGGILVVTILGVILAMVYAHTRSLLPCILIHMLNNGMAMLFFWVFTG